MRRYLQDQILKDLSKKMVRVTGPRQVGKTFLARQIMAGFKAPQYLNADSPEDRSVILRHGWPLSADLLVFDEIHKINGWKMFLKGIFDTRPAGQAILVTGSARLDALRRTRESLAGRYFHLRLHPLSVKELAGEMTADVRPYHRQIARALLREPKVYFYDSGFIRSDEGRRFKNSCAHALLKHVQFLHDVKGRDIELHYLRTKDKREVDFAVAEDGRLTFLLEAELGDENPSPHLVYFKNAVPGARAVQIVGRLRREGRDKGIEIARAADWLSLLDA